MPAVTPARGRLFEEFAIKGNMLDMAVGIIFGAAFGTIIQSLVNDVLRPRIGMLLGGAVTINYGVFANAVISFLIVAFAAFMVVRGFNKLKKAQA